LGGLYTKRKINLKKQVSACLGNLQDLVRELLAGRYYNRGIKGEMHDAILLFVILNLGGEHTVAGEETKKPT